MSIIQRPIVQRPIVQMLIVAGILMLLLTTTPALAQIATTTPVTSTAWDLHVRAVNLRSSTGQVVCTLFNSSTAFPSDSSKALRKNTVPIRNKSAICEFGGVPAGKYALVIFHDENSNGDFDRSWIGLPKEGYAFSNNVKPLVSAPSFKDAAFDYVGGSQWLTITMIY